MICKPYHVLVGRLFSVHLASSAATCLISCILNFLTFGGHVPNIQWLSVIWDINGTDESNEDVRYVSLNLTCLFYVAYLFRPKGNGLWSVGFLPHAWNGNICQVAGLKGEGGSESWGLGMFLGVYDLWGFYMTVLGDNLMGRPFWGRAKGPYCMPFCAPTTDHLYFVVRWCKKTKISSLANSFPGHAWVPLPNGM